MTDKLELITIDLGQVAAGGMEMLEKKMKPQLKVIVGGNQSDETVERRPVIAPHLEVVEVNSQAKCVGGTCSIEWKPTRPTAA